MPRTVHPVPGPGRWGLNTTEKDFVLHPFWATVANNMILDDGGVLAGRAGIGIVSVTSDAGAQILRQFYGRGATTTGFCSTAGDLFTNGSAGTMTNRTGALTPSAGYWQFAQFDDGQVRAAQDGETMIKSTGGGDFANETASSGTLPDGDHIMNAFGRLWGTNAALDTVIYSGTGDYRAFAAADGGGSIDLSNVWTGGRDYVTGLGTLGSALVVFGRNHIVFYADGSGSELGMDADQAYVVDIIEGVGCIARDTIQRLGDDLIFLSDRGVESLKRLLVSKDNPLEPVSWQIDTDIRSAIDTALDGLAYGAPAAREFTGVAYPQQNWYLLFIENGSAANDIYVFHMGHRQQDDKGRNFVPITKWIANDTGDNTDFLYNATHGAVTYHSSDLWIVDNQDLYEYKFDQEEDISDNAPIHVDFESGWMEIPDQMLNIFQLKTISFVYRQEETDTITPTIKWGTDYTASLQSKAAASATTAQRTVVTDADTDTDGRVFKLGITWDETSSGQGGGRVKLQSMNMLLAKGRLALDR